MLRNYHPRSEEMFDGVGVRYGHAVIVNDADVRGVAICGGRIRFFIMSYIEGATIDVPMQSAQSRCDGRRDLAPCRNLVCRS